MSVEAVSISPEISYEHGLIECPKCGFKIPEDVPVCWKCGEHQPE